MNGKSFLVAVMFSLFASSIAAATTVTVAAAGDIACAADKPVTPEACQMAATADLIAAADVDAVLALGDLQYPEGALEDFKTSYDPTWGRFKGVTYPVPGNHEYYTAGAAGYFAYFGDRAGDPQSGVLQFRPRCVAHRRAQLEL